MKKLMIMITILIGFSATAQADAKKEVCLAIGEVAMTVVEVRDNMPIENAINILKGVGLDTSFETYAMGVVAIAYGTDYGAEQYGQMVALDCMKEDL
jgi:hypothetical protein